MKLRVNTFELNFMLLYIKLRQIYHFEKRVVKLKEKKKEE